MKDNKSFTKGDLCVPVEEFVTRDYKKFKTMHGNRKVYDEHLARMVKAFQQKRIDLPIIINEKGEVCDGQTRLKACQKLGFSVRYRIMPELTIEDVQIINSNTRPWKIEDYLHSYCIFGRKDYLEVREFWEKHPDFTLGTTLLFLSKSMRSPTEVFRRGCFEVKSVRWAEKTAEEVATLSEFYDGWNKRDFVLAILKAVFTGHFEFCLFRKQLTMVPPNLVLKDCAKSRDYLRLIEEIYNYRQRKEVRFF